MIARSRCPQRVASVISVSPCPTTCSQGPGVAVGDGVAVSVSVGVRVGRNSVGMAVKPDPVCPLASVGTAVGPPGLPAPAVPLPPGRSIPPSSAAMPIRTTTNRAEPATLHQGNLSISGAYRSSSP